MNIFIQSFVMFFLSEKHIMLLHAGRRFIAGAKEFFFFIFGI